MRWNQAQIDSLLDGMAEALALDNGEPPPSLVGIQSGGAWVAEALNQRLATPLPLGVWT